MLKPSQRLQTVLKLALLKQQQAAENLAASIRQVEQQGQQSEQLMDYQSDYGEQFKAIGSQGASAGQLVNYQRFFADLDNAVTAQKQRAVLAEDQLVVARRQWQQQFSRQKNLESLIDRKQRQEQRELDTQLQREQDDRKPIIDPLGNNNK